MADLDLSVLIVSYNTRDLLRDCLRSVYEETRDLRFEVLVVDNASTDGSADMVAAEFPEVQLLRSSENLGFARANNRAAEHASGAYVLLLNPDTRVHDGALQRLVAFARRHPEHGLYGGRTLAADGEVDPSSCWGQPSLWSLLCFAAGLSTIFKRSRWLDPESLGRWPRDSVREVGVVTGCLCLAPRAVWDELGGFDDRYFMYGEDTDLSLRARRAGYRPVVTPDATVTHLVGASSARRAEKKVLVFRGIATLLRQRWSPLRRVPGLGLLAGGVALRALGSRLGARPADGKEAGFWSEVWSRRGVWWPGYPEQGPGRGDTAAGRGRAGAGGAT